MSTRSLEASALRFCRTCHHESCMQFLRTASSYSTWMPAIDGFDKSHKWSQVSLLFLRALTFESTVTEPSRQLFLSKLSVILSMSFDEEDALLSDKLRAIKELRSSKVGVAFALESTYWKIALSAKANGMIHGWALNPTVVFWFPRSQSSWRRTP